MRLNDDIALFLAGTAEGEEFTDGMKRLLRDAITAYLARLGEDGFILVPREPTEEMLDAGEAASESRMSSAPLMYSDIAMPWRAMIGAAPKP